MSALRGSPGLRVSAERPFHLGDWRVDPARRVISPLSGGDEIRLEPKAMDLLMAFVGSAGRVLSKAELVDAVWGGRAIGDETLTATVSRLRKALGAAGDRRYIETVSKRGYRMPPLVEEPQAQTTRPSDVAELVAKGEAAMASPLGLAQARLYFEAAVNARPDYAPAHAGLAAVLTAQHLVRADPSLLPLARSEARSAVALDPQHAGAWAALGYAMLLTDRDFDAADEALRRSIALAPDLADSRRRRAFGLAALGRFAEAEREARRALELEPLSVGAHDFLVQVLICARRYRAAVLVANAAIALSETASQAWYGRGWALVLAGETETGVASLLRGLRLWGISEEAVASLEADYVRGGFRALCAAGAELFERPHPLFSPRATDIAILWAHAGEPARALAALERAVASEDPWLLWAGHIPHLDGLREDPRFAELMKRVRPLRSG